MATRNETHVHDLSSLANFKDWAQSINTALTAFGWVQHTDTGQVNWGTIVSVPTSGNYVFEIWKPGDAGTVFYVRIDYGNSGGSSPAIKIQAGTTTNGSGTLTGSTTTTATLAVSSNSGATLYNCLYYGDTGSFGIMMWRDGAAVCFGVERSLNSSGATTNTYFTVYACPDSALGNSPASQQSVLFTGGAGPKFGYFKNFNTLLGNAASGQFSGLATLAVNGVVPLLPVFPSIGYIDFPSLLWSHACTGDFTEGAVITTTYYGATHTYIFSKVSNFVSFSIGLLMRWE